MEAKQEKFDAVQDLIRKHKESEETYEQFADRLGEAFEKDNFPVRFSKANVSHWLRRQHLPNSDRFVFLKRLADENTWQFEFANSMIEILNGTK